MNGLAGRILKGSLCPGEIGKCARKGSAKEDKGRQIILKRDGLT